MLFGICPCTLLKPKFWHMYVTYFMVIVEPWWITKKTLNFGRNLIWQINNISKIVVNLFWWTENFFFQKYYVFMQRQSYQCRITINLSVKKKIGNNRSCKIYIYLLSIKKPKEKNDNFGRNLIWQILKNIYFGGKLIWWIFNETQKLFSSQNFFP